MEAQAVYSVDGEMLETNKAHKQVKRCFYAGFAFLPLMWLMNVWLFWPDFISPMGDAYIKRYTRLSAIGLTISSVLFWPWFFFYVSSGSKHMDRALYDKIDVTQFDINKYLGF